MRKPILSLVLVFCTLSLLTLPDCATAFLDMAINSNLAPPSVNCASTNEVMNDKEYNLFASKVPVTREEDAVNLYRYLCRNLSVSPPLPYEDLVISVGDKSFTVRLEDNTSAQALVEKLPLTVTMGELNGNEKYYYLPQELPTAPGRSETIETGDLMLFGADCLVLFYESFPSSYSYTRLGRITNPSGLAEALGGADVEVTFRLQTFESSVMTSNDRLIPFFNLDTKVAALNHGFVILIYGLNAYLQLNALV